MQIQTHKEQMSYKRRKCISYKPNDFFQPYQQSVNLICNNFAADAQHILVQSLSILIEKIRDVDKKNNLISPQLFNKQKQNHLLNNQYFTFKKQIKINGKKQQEQNESTNTQQQIKQIVQYEKTGKKKSKGKSKEQIVISTKDWKNQISKTKKHDKLIKSLNKLAISSQKDDFSQFQKQNQKFNKDQFENIEREQTNLMEFDEDLIKNKSISQLLQQSAAKAKINQSRKKQPSSQSESEYQLTDHQSNQSSNEDENYQEKFCYENENGPIFGTIFGGFNKAIMTGKNLFNKTATQTNSGKLNPLKFNFKQIMNSPKKSKTKKKRLFINRKKVPRWAQNLNEVQNNFNLQNLRSEFASIFGICTVQCLRSNPIFNIKDQYTRASTAKWQPRQNGFLI